MSLLDQGTEIIVAVNGDWYRELARQGMLAKTADTTGAEILIGKVQNGTFHHGLLIELDSAISQFVDASFFIPWNVVLGISLETAAQRKNKPAIGFGAGKHAGAA